jgi:hypothetical protein
VARLPELFPKPKTMHKILLPVLLLLSSCLPPSDPYPFRPAAEVRTEADSISKKLENYIIAWLDGEVPAEIPDSLIPAGVADSKDFYLKMPEDATAEETWAVRFAKPIDKDSLYAGVPDPQVTYLYLGTAFAPMGSKLVIEGEFPHCRFFSFQISPPIDGEGYYAQREFGGAEVSMVDVDIEPLPGHTNPFHLGADRTAENRSYRVEFSLAAGDGVALNDGAFEYPYLKPGNNRRVGALMTYQGPLGFKTIAQTPLEHPGSWNLGAFWVRIYQPDDGSDPLGGVEMPKAYFELPDGRQYFIGSDFSRLQERADFTSPNQDKTSVPNPYFGPAVGWKKSWGITRSILNGVCQANGWSRQDSAQRIREIDLGWTGRGLDRPAPHNYEPHATTNNYINYLGRKVDIPPGKVLVLTGKMPTFPHTRSGEPVMQGGQVRYWSIAGINDDPLSPLPGTTIHAIVDDEVVLDDQRNYIIAYSQESDRPVNATAANGVSWVNAGTQTNHALLLRWLSVGKDWFTTFSPNEQALNSAVSNWASPDYDSTLIDVNWRQGYMRCFLPRVHLLDREVFENLGSDLSVEQIPAWVDSTLSIGPAESRLASITSSSLFDSLPDHQAGNALDGDLTTRWSSGFGQDTALLTLDFDSVRTLSSAKLIWDFLFFARDYRLEYSTDGQNWATWVSASGENGQIDLFPEPPAVQARYVRLHCTRANLNWYSLAELEVYISDCDCGEQLVTSTAPATLSPQGPEITVYPNPSSNTVFFDLPAEALNELYRIDAFDAQGSPVRQWPGRSQRKLQLSGLPSGVYYLAFSGQGWRRVVPVVVR